jgi:hypothetical protein
VAAPVVVTARKNEGTGLTTAPSYATRRAVQEALDIAETTRAASQIDRCLASASRSIDGLCHRRFYPQVATLTFDWPNEQHAASWRLWLDDHELISLTSLTSGGTTIPSPLLRPDWGPPFAYVELDRSAVGGFTAGPTPQRSITMVGVWGYDLNEATSGALSASCTSSAATIAVTDSSIVGPGSLLRVGTERLICTGAAVSTTGLTVSSGATTAANSDVTLTASGAGIVAGEIIMVDSERMLAVDVVGAVVTVKRAWDGSVLAAHTGGTTINALRTLSVDRGSLGTTAAAHGSADPVLRHVFPPDITNFTVDLSLASMGLQKGGSQVVNTRGGKAQTKASVDLACQSDSVFTTRGRKIRARAV